MKKLNNKNISFILLILFVVVFLVIKILITSSSNLSSEFSIKYNDYDLSVVSNMKIKVLDIRKSEIFNVEEYNYKIGIYIYGIKRIGILDLTKRIFENNDVMYFYKYKNDNQYFGVNVNIILNFKNQLKQLEFKKYEITNEYSSVIGFDKTTLPKYYVFNNDLSCIISKNYESREIVGKNYQNNSVVRELIAENENDINILNNEKINIKINQNREISEGWFLFSNKQLLNSEDLFREYTDFLNGRETPWITSAGEYLKIPYSILPFTRDGYSRIVGNNHGKEELKLYENNKNQLYSDLMWNKLVGLYKMPRNKYGVWLTEYTSTYVSSWGIYAPFIDSRYNENIAQFLLSIGEKYNLSKLKEDSFSYSNYVVEMIGKNNVIDLKNGYYLIPDYFSTDRNIQTHASINHQLGTANLLLQNYKYSGNKKYYDKGIGILKGITSLNEKWIKEDGDLYYRINPNLKFEGVDYKTLTLNDMLTVQDTLQIIENNRMPILDKYIKSKYNYLVSNNYKIEDSIMKKLRDQGFVQ